MALRHVRDMLLVFVVLAFGYTYFHQDPSWNGNTRLGLTFALVREGRVTIDSYYARSGTKTGDTSFFNGHYYSDKAPGSSILGALMYLPFNAVERLGGFELSVGFLKHWLTVLTIGLPSALAGTLMYLLARAVVGNRLYAFIATLAIALGTMALPYGIVFYGHQLVAVLLFCAFWMIFWLRRNSDLLRPAYLFGLGLLLGFALITEYPTALIVLPLVLYYLWLLWRAHPQRLAVGLLAPALGGLIPITMMLVYNTVTFGGPFTIGYNHVENEQFNEAMAQGLMGIHLPQPRVLFYLTFHPAMGQFWQSPILLLAVIGLVCMFRRPDYRVEALLATVVVLGYLLMNAGYFMWWGGWAFGPRHFVPALPFLLMPLLFVPERLRWLALPLTIISVAQMTMVAATNIHAPDDQIKKIDQIGLFDYSSIYTYNLGNILENDMAAWNMGRAFLHLDGWTTMLPFAVVILSAIAVFIYWQAQEAKLQPQPIVQASGAS